MNGDQTTLISTQFINALMMKLKLVFYMSNEEIFKKEDLSRELALVLQASLLTFYTAVRESIFDFQFKSGRINHNSVDHNKNCRGPATSSMTTK